MSDPGPCNCDQALQLQAELAAMEAKLALVDRLAQVRQALVEFYALDEVECWLINPQRQLGGRTPHDLVAAGESEKVFAIIEQLRTGAHV